MAMEGFIGHSHGGSTPCKRTNAQGFPKDQGCGENIAGGGGPLPRDGIDVLLSSDAHCLNMMDPGYDKVGVGFAFNSAATYRYYWTQNLGKWHHLPDHSCIGGDHAPTARPGCKDIDTYNCQFYKDQGYCVDNANMKEQCRETCNIDGCAIPVQDPQPTQDPAAPCADEPGQACAHYAKEGYCNTSNVQRHCRKSCSLCKLTGSEPEVGECHDLPYQMCAYFKDRGWCENHANVRRVCKSTCNSCNDSDEVASSSRKQAGRSSAVVGLLLLGATQLAPLLA